MTLPLIGPDDSCGNVWTSGVCTNHDACLNTTNWAWDLPHGREPLSYHSWALGQPDSNHQRSLALFKSMGHNFDNQNNHARLCFVCEIDLS